MILLMTDKKMHRHRERSRCSYSTGSQRDNVALEITYYAITLPID